MRTFRSPSLLLFAFLALALVLGACGSDNDADTGIGSGDDADSDDGTEQPGGDAAGDGVVAVALEEVDGFFTEGFEVGLRFEQPDGTVLATHRWNDVVAESGDGSIEAFYETVLEQPVPAGDVVVLATVNLGIGPPPEVPDLDGEMDCRLAVAVPAGGRVQVEVDFSGTSDCLRQIP